MQSSPISLQPFPALMFHPLHPLLPVSIKNKHMHACIFLNLSTPQALRKLNTCWLWPSGCFLTVLPLHESSRALPATFQKIKPLCRRGIPCLSPRFPAFQGTCSVPFSRPAILLLKSCVQKALNLMDVVLYFNRWILSTFLSGLKTLSNV